jgi:predicted heme/steroid binding protein
MGILFDTLTTDPETRAQLVRDAEKVLDAEVSDKKGITGLAVKGTFKVVKNLQPGFVPRAIDDLLNDFVKALEPIWETWHAQSGDQSCKEYFVANDGAVADALLSITDGRAQNTRHAPLKKAYEKLRPMGKEHVVASMPRVGALIERHTAELS